MTRGQRLALLGLAAVVAVVAVIVLTRPGESVQDAQRPTGSPSAPAPDGDRRTEQPKRPAKPKATEIRLRDGRPVGGPREVTVESGDTVRLAFESDTPQELHFHGYDRYVDLRPGRTARVSFPARLEGVFEIETHGTGVQVASLKVEP